MTPTTQLVGADCLLYTPCTYNDCAGVVIPCGTALQKSTDRDILKHRIVPGAGTLIAAEWDFEGHGDFPVVEAFTNEDLSYTSMRLDREYAFSAPGTYFPALRATSQRLGQGDNPHGRIMNLGRVRVVVQ